MIKVELTEEECMLILIGMGAIVECSPCSKCAEDAIIFRDRIPEEQRNGLIAQR